MLALKGFHVVINPPHAKVVTAPRSSSHQVSIPKLAHMAPTIAALGLVAMAMRPSMRSRAPTVRMTGVAMTYSEESVGLMAPETAEATRVNAWTE